VVEREVAQDPATRTVWRVLVVMSTDSQCDGRMGKGGSQYDGREGRRRRKTQKSPSSQKTGRLGSLAWLV
jgi:hypothetical protein